MGIIQNFADLCGRRQLAPRESHKLALPPVGHAVGLHERAQPATTEEPLLVRADVAQGVVAAATAEAVENN